MKIQPTIYLLALAMALFFSCADAKKEEASEKGVSTVLPDTKNKVTVTVLKKSDFQHELVSNGKVIARGLADLRFGTSEVITHIYVKNGDRVRRGQKLAELDRFRLNNRLAQAKDALEKARLELQNVLIGQGYSPDEMEKVPAEIMQLAKVKSGYDQSKIQYELTQYEEEHATLVAPFDGVVANLFTKPYNLSSTADVFCTLVDTQGMEVDFTVLENELALIKTGDKVAINPYAATQEVYEGRVSEINPVVDDKGMVKVRAQVNGKGKLFSGMNVRVSVHRSLGNQLVIPKSAVVLRSGKQVVFTLSNGRSMWNYVETGLENAQEYVVSDKANPNVTDGLLEGDTVIVTGNINLAHEAEVSTTDR